jgi:DNA-binding NarL/FixJ family response regulator
MERVDRDVSVLAHAKDEQTTELLTFRDDRLSPFALVESRALIRDCLSRCITADFGTPVVSFSSVESLREASFSLNPSLVIIGDCAGVERRVETVIEALSRAGVAAPVVVFSDAENIDDVVGTLRSGASGHVPTGVTLDVAIEALRQVLVGGVFVPRGAASLNAERKPSPAEARIESRSGFTTRQYDVLESLCAGKTNKQIAFELEMSQSTVKVHVRNIMKKLQAKNRTEVAVKVARLANEIGRAGSTAENNRRAAPA